MSKIYGQKKPLSEADRLELARLLIKAGYVVNIHSEKVTGKTTTRYVVEYEIREGENQ